MAWFTKKEWKNRLAEFAGRRTLTDVATGASQVVDVARNEGTISQEGDAFSAANMNEFEQRILEGFTQAENATTELNQNMQFPDNVGFYPDIKDGVRGYNTDAARGADTFFPFKSGNLEIEILYVDGYKEANGDFNTYIVDGTSKISNFTGFRPQSYGTFEITDFDGTVNVLFYGITDQFTYVTLTINGVEYRVNDKEVLTFEASSPQTIKIDYSVVSSRVGDYKGFLALTR